MKKLISVIYLLLFVLTSYGQVLTNKPATSATIEAFKYNPLNLTYEFDTGVTVPTITAEVYVSGAKISIVPTVSITGQIATVSLTAAQMARLPGISELYLKFGTGPSAAYRIGAKILPSVTMGLPSTVANTVVLSDIGTVKINVIGDAAATKQYMLQARAAKDSAVTLLGNQWYHTNIVASGTSIVYQGGTESYVAQAARKLGAAIYNEAISGSKIMLFPGHSPGLSGTYGENAFAGQNNSYEYCITRYEGLQASPPFPAKAQLVIIAHGENDYPYLPDSLGTISDNKTNSFYGALNRVITRVLESNYTIKIVLCTPVSVYPYGVYSPGMDAAATAIRAVGKKWGIPVCDFSAEAGLNNVTNVAGKFSTDGLHPNQATTDKLATILYRFLLTVR